MTRVIAMFIGALSALLLMLTLGCSDDSTAPEERLPPGLGSGYSQASWRIEGAQCPDGQLCVGSVLVHQHPDREPEICIQVVRDGGPVSLSAVMSSEDFGTYVDLAGSVIESRGQLREGCEPMGGLSETVDTFAGDAGWSAAIEGCDGPIVEELRSLNRELVVRYFSVDRGAASGGTTRSS